MPRGGAPGPQEHVTLMSFLSREPGPVSQDPVAWTTFWLSICFAFALGGFVTWRNLNLQASGFHP